MILNRNKKYLLHRFLISHLFVIALAIFDNLLCKDVFVIWIVTVVIPTGSINSPYYWGNISGTWNTTKALYQGNEIIINGVLLFSTYSTVNSGILLYSNKK